jgi:predicted RNA binding protein YcfA (HicA-like mRNA interferase family)
VRVPRDLSGTELARLLERYGYRITRQTGSHLRLTSELGGQHHITIPAHPSLRVGTLGAILRILEDRMGKSRDELLRELFE